MRKLLSDLGNRRNGLLFIQATAIVASALLAITNLIGSTSFIILCICRAIVGYMSGMHIKNPNSFITRKVERFLTMMEGYCPKIR